MNRRKRNISPLLAGLAAALTVLTLLGAVGTSYARYRVDGKQSLLFTARKPAKVCLGLMVTPEEGTEPVFDPKAVGSWETVDNQSQLAFTVANGTSAQDCSREDQQFSVRLVGSLGIWDGQNTVDVTLRIPKEPEPETETQPETETLPAETTPAYEEFSGRATRIQVDSPLYKVYGDGWVFSFPDENGVERTWLLEGGTFSSMDMTVILEGVELTDPSLLQPVITGYFVK